MRLIEALGLQHDVESLIPRHVLQADRHAALHRVVHHDVLAAGIREDLQQRAHFDVLERQADALAGEHRLVFGGLRELANRAHLDDVLVVRLVGELLVVARWR